MKELINSTNFKVYTGTLKNVPDLTYVRAYKAICQKIRDKLDPFIQ